MLDHCFDIVLTLGLSLLMMAIGRTLAKRMRVKFTTDAEDLSFSLFLGLGVLGLSVLFFGLLGLLRPWPILILLGVYVAIVVTDLPNLYRLFSGTFRAATSTREGKGLVLLFLFFLGILVLRTATPLHIGDESIYHLPVPKQFIQHGRVFPLYDNSLGNLPFLIQMIYALFLMAGSDIAPKLFSLLLAVFTALALYGYCARHLTRRVGLIALFGFFAAGMVVEVAVTARIDVSLAGILFMATYAMINFLETQRREWLWLSAVLGGFSLGIKHSAGMWLLLIGGMFVIESLISKREHLGSVLKNLFAYTCLAAAVASPWYIKNYVWFHNPVYPVLTGEVVEFSPKAIRYFNINDEHTLDAHFELARKEIPELVTQQEEQLRQAVNQRPSRHPMRLWEFFTQPNKYLMSEPFHYPNYLFLFIPLLLFLRRNRWIMWLLALSVIFAFSVTFNSWLARYLLPIYPPLTVVTAYTLSTWFDQLNGRAAFFARRLPAWTLIVSLSIALIVSAPWIGQTNSLAFLTGKMSRHQFLNQFPHYRPFEFINTQLPPTAKVMLLGVQSNYDIERGYLADETWFATKWRRLLAQNASFEEVNQELKRQGVTHILYSPGLFIYAATTGLHGAGGMQLMAGGERSQTEESRRLGAEYQLLRNWSTFELYRTEFLETIYSDQNCQIFKIK